MISETSLDAAQEEYVTNARTAATSLLSLINDVLDYSKLAAGLIELEKRPMLLGNVLGEVECIAKSLRSDVRLEVEKWKGPAVVADGMRVRQILVNLVGNALKFISPGGQVRVLNRWEIVDGGDGIGLCRVTMTVTDNGIGMSPSVLARLFTPFTQGDSSTSRRFGGTGLGLSIVKRILDAMDGTIRVESSEGVGSSFEVSFCAPVAKECEDLSSKSKVTTTVTPAPKGTVRRILVAEDNIIIQKLISQILRPIPRVDVVSNGAEAVHAVQSNQPYDVFLCDLNMPVLDGLEATKQIRQTGNGRKGALRIIGLTANAFKSDRENCLNAGMDDYLSKPFTKKALLEVVGIETAGL